jgi:hypothetical protein
MRRQQQRRGGVPSTPGVELHFPALQGQGRQCRSFSKSPTSRTDRVAVPSRRPVSIGPSWRRRYVSSRFRPPTRRERRTGGRRPRPLRTTVLSPFASVVAVAVAVTVAFDVECTIPARRRQHAGGWADGTLTGGDVPLEPAGGSSAEPNRAHSRTPIAGLGSLDEMWGAGGTVSVRSGESTEERRIQRKARTAPAKGNTNRHALTALQHRLGFSVDCRVRVKGRAPNRVGKGRANRRCLGGPRHSARSSTRRTTGAVRPCLARRRRSRGPNRRKTPARPAPAGHSRSKAAFTTGRIVSSSALSRRSAAPHRRTRRTPSRSDPIVGGLMYSTVYLGCCKGRYSPPSADAASASVVGRVDEDCWATT